MTDFNQGFKPSEVPDSFKENNGPQAFQDFAANLWAPNQGGANAERTGFRGNGGGGNQGGQIPEIPGVLTKLEGVTNAPKTEVTVQAKVAAIMPDFDNPRNGLKHEQFVIELADGTDVFVAHDLNYAPHVPLTVGEDIKIKGEWIPKPNHENHAGLETIGVLHWTHESENEHKHPSGWIEAGGKHYESL